MRRLFQQKKAVKLMQHFHVGRSEGGTALMRKIPVIATCFGLALTVPAQGEMPSYAARVEGTTVIISGVSDKAQNCLAVVHFSYLPAGDAAATKREDGYLQCPRRDMEPGKETEFCRMTFPTTRDIKITTPVDVACK